MSEKSKNVLIQRLEIYATHTDIAESHNIINKRDETGAYDLKPEDFSITDGDNFIGNYCDIDGIHIIYSWKIREKSEDKKSEKAVVSRDGDFEVVVTTGNEPVL
jgi:hypothetical protein